MFGARPPVDTTIQRGARHFAQHLLPYEDVVAAERRHWARLIEPIASVIGALIVASWLDLHLPQNVPVLREIIWVGFLATVVRLLFRYVEWRTDWFVATNKRVILTYGVLTRRVAMMPLMKVTDMSYNRSVLGRLLGYGEFVLESAGQEQALRTVSFLPRPDDLYEEICLEIFGSSPPPPPPPPGGGAGPTPPPGPGGVGGVGGVGGGFGVRRGRQVPGSYPGSSSLTTIVPIPAPDPADD
jgi:membrane protein YdbS with pleckstrin-like domain